MTAQEINIIGKPQGQHGQFRHVYCVMLVFLSMALAICLTMAVTYFITGLSIDSKKVVIMNTEETKPRYTFPKNYEDMTILPFETVTDVRSLVLAVGIGGLVICAYLSFHIYQVLHFITQRQNV